MKNILCLLICMLGMASVSAGFAGNCEEIVVTIVNDSDFDWHLDPDLSNNEGAHNYPDILPAHTTDSYTENSTNWAISNPFEGGNKYKETIVYTMNSKANPHGEKYYVELKVENDICEDFYAGSCITISASGSGVEQDPAYIADVTRIDSGKSTCVKKCYGVPCGYTNEKRSYVDFLITTPHALGIKIELPAEDDPTLKNQTFLQETFNHLAPGTIKHFDTVVSNPLGKSDGTFDFILPCTSKGCLCYLSTDPNCEANIS